MRRLAALATLACLTGALSPPSAIARTNNADTSAALAAFHERTRLDQRLQDIGWKLVSGNASYCANVIPSVGLQLHDMASYRRPAAMRELLGLDRDIAILTAAAKSPSAAAGLATNQGVEAIAGIDPANWEAEPHSDWRRTKRMHDWVDQRLAEDGSVTLTLTGARDVQLAPVPVCASRFELGGSNKRAVAEGSRVIFGAKFPGFDYAEAEFAAAIAHELAHNVLRHRVWLDANGRKRRNIRLTEREADRLMPWLIANAGYDPAAATRFMERWGRAHDGGLFRKRTHDGWDERAEFIAAEVAKIEMLRAEGRAADWSTLFEREIEP